MTAQKEPTNEPVFLKVFTTHNLFTKGFDRVFKQSRSSWRNFQSRDANLNRRTQSRWSIYTSVDLVIFFIFLALSF